MKKRLALAQAKKVHHYELSSASSVDSEPSDSSTSGDSSEDNEHRPDKAAALQAKKRWTNLGKIFLLLQKSLLNYLRDH